MGSGDPDRSRRRRLRGGACEVVSQPPPGDRDDSGRARGRRSGVGALVAGLGGVTRGSSEESVMSLHPAEILIRPVVSEKSYEQIQQNRYTFRVHKDAHKTQIRQAVEELFDVKVVAVNVVKVQPKPKRRGMIKGTRQGWKKAIVQVREGDEIQIFQGAQV